MHDLKILSSKIVYKLITNKLQAVSWLPENGVQAWNIL